jgi:hypothetical protein
VDLRHCDTVTAVRTVRTAWANATTSGIHTRLRLKERALVPLLLWQTYRHRETLSRRYRLQVEGCEAKGVGRSCDGDGSRLCDGFVQRDSTFLGGPFTRFCDYARVYDFTITTKPLRFDKGTIFDCSFCCAHTKGVVRLACRIFTTLYTRYKHNYTCGTIRLFCACRTNARRTTKGFTSLRAQIQRGREGSVCALKVRDLMLYAVHFSRHIGGRQSATDGGVFVASV